MIKLEKYQKIQRNSFVYDYTTEPVIFINETKEVNTKRNKLVKNIFRRGKHGKSTSTEKKTRISYEKQKTNESHLMSNNHNNNSYNKKTNDNKFKLNLKKNNKKMLSCCKIS